MEKEEAKRDRISEMPEEIKEQIVLSLCMKDAVCTSSLSSVWRYSWVSLPFLDFGYQFYRNFTDFFGTLSATHPKKRHLYSIFYDKVEVEEEEDDSESSVDDPVDDSDSDYDYDYDYDSEDEFNDWLSNNDSQVNKVGYLQTLDEFLQIYIKKNPSLRGLKKMSLYVPMISVSKMRDYAAPIVSRCLSLAKHNVTELKYWNEDYRNSYYSPRDSYNALQNCLPILDSRTLTKLELCGCYLAMENNVEVPIDLPNLKHLHLLMFHVNESMLENLIAKCRALEKLQFSFCKGFKVLRVPRVSKLKKLRVDGLFDLDLIEINALEIQCLSLSDFKRRKCNVKMASDSCNNLVTLYMDHCGVTDDFFNNVAEFPHLETVSLLHCPELKHIKITGNSLTSLVIKGCPNLSHEVVTLNPFFSRYSSCYTDNIKWLSKRAFNKILYRSKHLTQRGDEGQRLCFHPGVARIHSTAGPLDLKKLK